MNKRQTFLLSAIIGLNSMLFMACSSNVKRADIPSSANPQEEITKLDADLNTAATKNIDVLAASEYKDSAKWLKEAKSDQGNKSKQEDILEDLRKGRGFLEKAYVVSQNRAEKAPGLFSARQAALAAGAAKYSELHTDLQTVDEDVADSAVDLSKVSTEKISALQERYVGLERRATILGQLGPSQAILNGAQKDGATKRAPLTYKKAELSLKNAESVISTNVRNPNGYKADVAIAVADTTLLAEVMSAIQQNGKGLSEAAAVKMVAQNRQIKALNTDLAASNSESAASKAAMNDKNLALAGALQVKDRELNDKDRELSNKDQDLKSANNTVDNQKAMEAARSQFSPQEAEAYQQGGNLLIRLKQVNFASGRSDLPGASLGVLAKVSNIAKSMHASEIKVEGHTDSVGTANQNKTISEQRAAAVASYFKTNGFDRVTSEGYGFQKPLATNKTKDGRAQNRRVDIIITPDTSTVTK